MRLPSFDPSDLLLTKALLCLIALGALVLSVGVPLAGWLSGGALRWKLEGLGTTDVPARLAPQDGVRLQGADAVTVRMDDAGASAWLATLLPGVLLSVTVCLAAWLLLRLLRSLGHGTPFVPASAASLRRLAAVILLGNLAVSLGRGVADVVITQHAFEGLAFGFHLDLSGAAFVGALLALALSEAFAQGTRLADDVDGLV